MEAWIIKMSNYELLFIVIAFVVSIEQQRRLVILTGITI